MHTENKRFIIKIILLQKSLKAGLQEAVLLVAVPSAPHGGGSHDYLTRSLSVLLGKGKLRPSPAVLGDVLESVLVVLSGKGKQ